MNSPTQIVLRLDSAEATLALVGGKGRSLARLAAAGLPVPEGFLLTTGAYGDFVESNEIQGAILRIVAEAATGGASTIEAASTKIQALFESAKLSEEISLREPAGSKS